MNIKPVVVLDSKINHSKLQVFLQQTGIKKRLDAKLAIEKHLQTQAEAYPYVLFRHHALYFFNHSGLLSVENFRGQTLQLYLRFDGQRITRLDPEYYLGLTPKGVAEMEGMEDLFETGSSNNNNNNNNNNNGNNNG